MTATEPCGCLDFEPEEEDTLCVVCTCGHVDDEHARGFFRRCLVGQDDANREASAELRQRAEELLAPLDRWAKRCHEASLELVRGGIADRVARGTATGVGAQHSWAVVGCNCYDDDALLVDATLWSWQKDGPARVYVGTLADRIHRPHGYGSIWDYGRPVSQGGKTIALKRKKLSADAQIFLAMVGPLDRPGWMRLASCPVGGWPAAEVLAAMDDTPALQTLVPIDRLGMLTDRNPGGLYLAGKEKRRV